MKNMGKTMLMFALLWSFSLGATASDVKKTKKNSAQFTCESKRKCSEMNSCDEAYFYLQQCGVSRLDRDKDGIPCESICN